MLKKIKNKELDFEIDCLTNSIRNIISGDSFQTEVTRVLAIDLKKITKKMAGILIGKLNSEAMVRKFTN